jgi:hypothetical protein
MLAVWAAAVLNARQAPLQRSGLVDFQVQVKTILDAK